MSERKAAYTTVPSNNDFFRGEIAANEEAANMLMLWAKEAYGEGQDDVAKRLREMSHYFRGRAENTITRIFDSREGLRLAEEAKGIEG